MEVDPFRVLTPETRPWYVSVTAIWKDGLEDIGRLEDLALDHTQGRYRAGHHLPIDQNCWHSTVFAVLKINGKPAEDPTMREFAGRVFQALVPDGARQTLRRAFRPFVARLCEVRCYENSTALQFECDPCLSEFRDAARAVFLKSVTPVINFFTESEGGRAFEKASAVPIIVSIVDDSHKNRGAGLFGSVARSPARDDSSVERWRAQVKGIALQFRKLHFLVSDEMLTNPREAHEDLEITDSGGA